jgi:hypothetical protein
MKACADAVEGLNRRVDAYCARRADEFAEQPAQDIREDDLSRTMYKGYAIVLNHDDKMFYISKGGAHVGTASSMSAAKEMVDMDAKGTFKNDDRRVIGGTEIEITGVSDK